MTNFIQIAFYLRDVVYGFIATPDLTSLVNNPSVFKLFTFQDYFLIVENVSNMTEKSNIPRIKRNVKKIKH